VPAPDWLARGVEQLQRECRPDAIGGRVDLMLPEKGRRNCAELFEIAFGFRQQRYVEREHYAATANMMAWRSTFDGAGLFYGETLSGGDNEWGKRAHAHGYRMVYAESAVVRHPLRGSVPELLEKRRRVTLGQCALAREKPEFRYRYFVKLAKFLPSIRYRIAPALGAAQLKPAERIRLAGFIIKLHFHEYGWRLSQLPSLVRCGAQTPA
jgi:GT2 family glycosyltransferase